MTDLKDWVDASQFAALLARKQYGAIIDCCKDLPASQAKIHALSLLYRFSGNYYEEEKLVGDHCAHFPTWEYINLRRDWHCQDDFDKVVPRPVFRSESDPWSKISEQDVDKLIFVTGGDSLYYTWIVESIESIRAGGFFKEVMIGILDCGLLDEQKHSLNSKFDNIKIVDPGFDFADPRELDKSWQCGIPEGNTKTYKAITARGYLDRHFPGYEYYLWIDSDAWVQDESALLDYILMAKEKGIGISENNFEKYCSGNVFYNDRYMTDEMLVELQYGKRSTCAGVICLTPEFMEKWRFEIEYLYRKKKVVNNSPSLWFAIHKYVDAPEFLPHAYQFFFQREGLPLIDENQLLHGPETSNPCGIIHLNGFYGVREKYRYFPTIGIGQEFDLDAHIKTSRKAIQQCKNDLSVDPMSLQIFEDQTQFSFRYRVWPWRDKKELEEEFKQLLI